MTAQTSPSPSVFAELAEMGTATVHESGGQVVDLDLHQIVAGSSVAGPARLAVCQPGDNRAVHEVIGRIDPGDVVVLSMPEPNRFGVIGDLLVRQAMVRGAVGFVVDAGVRDTDQLRALGLPIWARYVRPLGTTKVARATSAQSVVIGGALVVAGDVIVADSDGVVVVAASRLAHVLELARERETAEAALRTRIADGETTFEIFELGT